MDDKYNPHDKSSTEKPEASPEKVTIDPHDVNAGSATDSPMERGPGQISQPDKPLPSKGGGRSAGSGRNSAQRPAGITKRPVEQATQRRDEWPPKGKAPGQS